MTIFRTLLMMTAAAVLATGCGTKGGPAVDTGEPKVEERTVPDADDAAGRDGAEDGTTASPVPDMEGVEAYPMVQDPDDPLGRQVIYFDYDKSEVRSEFQDVVSAHAQFLSTHPKAHVTLEGHADERGSREYNIGLGERRAEAVRRLMLFQGAREDQIETVSYGEERPVAMGHSDDAWSQNRRVEIVYRR